MGRFDDGNKGEENAAWVKVYLPPSLKQELEARAVTYGDEGCTVSKIGRMAFREWLRRHPVRGS